MKRVLLSVVAFGVLGAGVVGCETKAGTGALVGGAAGAGIGAIVGHNSHGRTGSGALIGGAVGAIGGGAVGHEMDKAGKRGAQRGRAADGHSAPRGPRTRAPPLTRPEGVERTPRGGPAEANYQPN